jgi:UPF0755 protein
MERDPKQNVLALGALGIIFLFIAWFLSAPSGFEPGLIVTIPEGVGVAKMATILKEDEVIRSTIAFRAVATLLGERRMKAGEYSFASSPNMLGVAWRIARGDHQIATAKVTVPEGFTVKDISGLFGQKFPLFDNAAFEATAPQGYLFPDTYFVSVTATAAEVVKLMHDNFVRKIFSLTPEIDTSGHTVEQIVTMASLLEAEAKTPEDRAMVADVLWKRLKLGMPLQVDSEMGTYEFQGLPAKPINNPGLVSLEAAVHPTTTPYLYFLSDKKGMMHYAKTFDEHQANIAKYLR